MSLRKEMVGFIRHWPHVDGGVTECENAMIRCGFWPYVNESADVIGWSFPHETKVQMMPHAKAVAAHAVAANDFELFWIVQGWEKDGREWKKGAWFMSGKDARRQFEKKGEQSPF